MAEKIILAEYKIKIYKYADETFGKGIYSDIDYPPSSGNIEVDNSMIGNAIESLLGIKTKWTFTQYTPSYLQKQFKGWYKTIEKYFDRIQSIVDREGLKLNIYYIKEKYGHIDLSFSGYNDEIMDLIIMLEEESTRVCDICGKRGKLRDDLGRWRTLCKTHYEEIKKK